MHTRYLASDTHDALYHQLNATVYLMQGEVLRSHVGDVTVREVAQLTSVRPSNAASALAARLVTMSPRMPSTLSSEHTCEILTRKSYETCGGRRGPEVEITGRPSTHLCHRAGEAGCIKGGPGILTARCQLRHANALPQATMAGPILSADRKLS
jgi:hypothetical protein